MLVGGDDRQAEVEVAGAGVEGVDVEDHLRARDTGEIVVRSGLGRGFRARRSEIVTTFSPDDGVVPVPGVAGVVGKAHSRPGARASLLGHPRHHLGADHRGPGEQMTRRHVVPPTLGRQVRQQLRRVLAVGGGHPRVGVRAGDAVQDVVVGRASRDRGADRWGARAQAATYSPRPAHRRPRPPRGDGPAGSVRRAVAGRRGRPGDVRRRADQRGRLVQPVPGHRGRVVRDVGADLRLPRRLLDGRTCRRHRRWPPSGRPPTTA